MSGSKQSFPLEQLFIEHMKFQVALCGKNILHHYIHAPLQVIKHAVNMSSCQLLLNDWFCECSLKLLWNVMHGYIDVCASFV